MILVKSKQCFKNPNITKSSSLWLRVSGANFNYVSIPVPLSENGNVLSTNWKSVQAARSLISWTTCTVWLTFKQTPWTTKLMTIYLPGKSTVAMSLRASYPWAEHLNTHMVIVFPMLGYDLRSVGVRSLRILEPEGFVISSCYKRLYFM